MGVVWEATAPARGGKTGVSKQDTTAVHGDRRRQGGHADYLDRAGTPSSIVEEVRATNKPWCCSVLRVVSPAQRNRVGTSSDCAVMRTALSDDWGGRAGHWNHSDAPTLIAKNKEATRATPRDGVRASARQRARGAAPPSWMDAAPTTSAANSHSHGGRFRQQHLCGWPSTR